MEELINRLEILSGVEVSVEGDTVWVKGDTKEYRQELKELGGRWSPTQIGWWFKFHDKKNTSKNSNTRQNMNTLQFLTYFKRCIECGAISFELDKDEVSIIFNENALDKSN